MLKFKNFDELVSKVKGKPNRVVVPGANNHEVIQALKMGDEAGLISEGTLIGDKKAIKDLAARARLALNKFHLIQELDIEKMCDRALAIIKEGKGDFLVKGLVDTRFFLKSILKKEFGFVDDGSVLTHFVLFQTAHYHKLFSVSDAAILISPSLEEKRHIVQNSVDVMRVLGCETPKVAVVCPVEKVNPKIPSTVDAEELAKMSQDGRIKNAVVEGPYDIYITFSRKLANEKGVKGGVVPGDVDCTIFPDLDAANSVYKSISYFAEGLQSAAIVAGAKLPIILPSRTDEPLTKMLSIALSSYLKEQNQPV